MKKYFGIVLLVFLSTSIAITAQKANPASDFEYELDSTGTGIRITKYKGTSKDVIIPSMIEDLPVVHLGGNSFEDSKIVSVIIPNSITLIGGYCFSKCKYLEKVTLPKGLVSLYGYCFSKCEALKEIVLPQSLKGFNEGVFSESGLTSIIIPDSVQVIGDRVFEKCKALIDITIPDSIQVIGYGAFSDCTALINVSIGKGIRTIGGEAFLNCSSLTTFNIGEHKMDNETFKFKIDGRDYYVGISGDTFRGCSSLSIKEQKKLRDTGYTGGF